MFMRSKIWRSMALTALLAVLLFAVLSMAALYTFFTSQTELQLDHEANMVASAMEGGADDYVTKPFGMMELIARVKAVIRRCAGRGEGVLTLGGIRLDREKHTVEADGKEVVLTFREFELLRYLMEHPEKAFDRDRLLDEVWGAEYEGGPRTVDMHVQTIRKKLGRCASQIETIYGLGYKIGEGNNHAQ